MTDRDYYQVLGVGRDASADDVKKAYRRLARKYHPDVSRDEPKAAEERFKEVSEAYEVLADSEKRGLYDKYGHAAVRQGFSGGSFSWEDFSHYSDIEDIFGSIFGGRGFGGMGGIFEQMFSGARGGTAARRGADLVTEIDVSLEDVMEGTERQLDIEHSVRCGRCSGSGSEPGHPAETCAKCGGQGRVQQVQRTPFGVVSTVSPCHACRGAGTRVTKACAECGGSGAVSERKTISLSVPTGVDTGSNLRVAGKGQASTSGGPPGDLYVVVRVRPDRRFKRDGIDLHQEAEVSYPLLALGGQIEVPTLRGKKNARVPAGTSPYDVIRLRGEGLPAMRGAGKGDMYVHLRLKVPGRLGKKEKDLLKRLQDIEE